MHILVVTDEPKLAEWLKRGLERSGFTVDIAPISGAKEQAAAAKYATVLLDIKAASADYTCLIAMLRRVTTDPLLVLTKRDTVARRLDGLRHGANDFLVKPFTFSALLARIDLLAPAASGPPAALLKLADLKIDPCSQRCWRGASQISLSRKEFRLLLTLLTGCGEIFSVADLAYDVWNADVDHISNVVEVTIRRLRTKIDGPFEIKLLHTVRGGGYVLTDGMNVSLVAARVVRT